MSDYQLLEGGGVKRLSDDASIPNDPDNRDWQAYQEWLAKGGKPDPYVPPKPDPAEVEAEALRESARAKLAEVAGLTPDEVAAWDGTAG